MLEKGKTKEINALLLVQPPGDASTDYSVPFSENHLTYVFISFMQKKLVDSSDQPATTPVSILIYLKAEASSRSERRLRAVPSFYFS